MLKKFIAVLGCSASLMFAADMQVGAYYPNWLQYSQFTPADVRYDFLTDIHYGYFIPSEDGSSIANADESDDQNFEKLAELAKTNKVGLTVILGGAGNEDAMKAVATSDDAKSALKTTLSAFASKYGVTAVELDWVPAEESDYAAWGALVDAVASADLKVNVSVIGSADMVDLYPADAMAKAATVMVSFPDQMTEEQESVIPNVDFAKAKDILKAYAGKADASKIVPVVPMYGKSFYKASGLGSSFEGVGSGNEGFLAYKDLMSAFDTPDYKVTFDEATQSEVAVSASETIVFNGIPSMKSMASFVKENGFGGIALYDISGDHKEPVVSLLVTVGQVLRPEIKYNVKKKKH